jgi:hypothetical protein
LIGDGAEDHVSRRLELEARVRSERPRLPEHRQDDSVSLGVGKLGIEAHDHRRSAQIRRNEHFREDGITLDERAKAPDGDRIFETREPLGTKALSRRDENSGAREGERLFDPASRAGALRELAKQAQDPRLEDVKTRSALGAKRLAADREDRDATASELPLERLEAQELGVARRKVPLEEAHRRETRRAEGREDREREEDPRYGARGADRKASQARGHGRRIAPRRGALRQGARPRTPGRSKSPFRLREQSDVGDTTPPGGMRPCESSRRSR